MRALRNTARQNARTESSDDASYKRALERQTRDIRPRWEDLRARLAQVETGILPEIPSETGDDLLETLAALGKPTGTPSRRRRS